MDILTLFVVGMVAGLLAALVVGGGYGLVADILIGVAGAFLGGWIFVHAGWHAPLHGIGGTIAVAFVGAVILLVLLHLVQGASGGWRRRRLM